mmetsp:Transcript_124562/g.360211  ORF Transcript_124562/g.360211 Transcript_124562/m.360211 type:complete len:221 (+) Transcript_124562:90-752(+)
MPVAGPLRLPEIRPLPCPMEEEMRLLSHLRGSSADEECSQLLGRRMSPQRMDRDVSRTRHREGPARWRAAQPGRVADDFLFGDGVERRSASRAGTNRRTTARPTQRQPIDDQTSVPCEVFESMLRAGAEARKRAVHRLAFAPSDGKPYLKHQDADKLRAMATPAPSPVQAPLVASPVPVVQPMPPTPTHVLPRRPSSACASEAMAAGGMRTSDVVPVQVA